MNENQIKEKLLELIHSKTGWGNPLRSHCEIEDLYIQTIQEFPDGKQIATFRYIFDEDGFSQYDKTHVFDGSLTIASGNFIKIEMEEVHAGVAAIRRYKSK